MKIVSFLFLLFVLVGCSDSNTASTNSSGGEGVTGDLLGTVNLVDYRGRQIQDKSGVLVKCEGTSYSALTDTGGNWIIHNLPTRTYNIGFSKDGFYSFHDPIYTFVAGAPLRYFGSRGNHFGTIVTIGQPPRYTITMDGLILPTKHTDSLNRIITTSGFIYLHSSNDVPDSTTSGILFIAGTTPLLDIEDKSSYIYKVWVSVFLNSTQDSVFNYTLKWEYDDEPISKLSVGQTIYVRTYPMLRGDDEYDPVTDQSHYIGYSHTGSNILSAIKQ